MNESGGNSTEADYFDPYYIPPSPYPLWFQLFLWLLVGLMSLETILGNLLVLLSYYTDRSLRQPSNFFIASLAVSDLIIGLEGFPVLTIYVVNGERWSLGRLSCKLWLSLDYTLCLVSILTVLLITVDRFCSVCHAASYRRWQSMEKVRASIILSWLIPTALFFPTIFGFDDDPDPTKCYAPFLNDPYLNMSLYITYYWTTLVLMIVLYHGIHKTAKVLEERGKAKERQQVAMAALQQCMAKMGVGLMISAHEKSEAESPQTVPRHNSRVENGPVDDSGYTSTGCYTNAQNTNNSEDIIANNSTSHRELVHGSIRSKKSGISASTTSDSLKSYCTTQSGQSYSDCSFSTALELAMYEDSNNGGESNGTVLGDYAKRLMAARHLSLGHDSISISSTYSSQCVDCVNAGYETDLDIAPIPEECFPASSSPCCGSGSGSSPQAQVHRLHGQQKAQCRSLQGSQKRSHLHKPVRASLTCSRSSEPSESGSFKTARTSSTKTVRKVDSLRVSTKSSTRAVSANSGSSSAIVEVFTGASSSNTVSPLKVFPKSQAAIIAANSIINNQNNNKNNNSNTGQNNMLAPKADFSELRLPKSQTISSHMSIKAAPPTENNNKTNNNNKNMLMVAAEAAPKKLSIFSSFRRSRSTRYSTSSNLPTDADSSNPYDDDDDSGSSGAEAVQNAERRKRQKQRSKQQRGAEHHQKGRRHRPRAASVSRISIFLNAAWTQRKRKQTRAEKRARKAFRTISIILGSFVLFWSPYYIIATVYGFCADCVPSALFILSYYMCYLNSSLNPFCYALANRQYKTAFLRILRGDLERR